MKKITYCIVFFALFCSFAFSPNIAYAGEPSEEQVEAYKLARQNGATVEEARTFANSFTNNTAEKPSWEEVKAIYDAAISSGATHEEAKAIALACAETPPSDREIFKSAYQAAIESGLDSSEAAAAANAAVLEAKANSIAISDSTYHVKEYYVSFTVPTGWIEAPKEDTWEYIDAKFISTQDESIAILCIFSDAYDDLNATLKQFCSREEINNSLFSDEDIAEMFGCDVEDVSIVKYGGKEYYKAETSATDATYNITLPITALALYENGYLYMYQFSGHSDSVYFNDFESLVASAKYPSVPVASTSPMKETANKSQSAFEQFAPINILVSLILTVVIYSLPIIIYRYVIKKEPVSKKKAKRITIIYAIPAFFVMSIIIFSINGSGAAGGAIFLWSYINYRMLIGGKKEANTTTEPIAEQQELSITDTPVCDTEPNNENSATSGVSKVHVTVSQKKSAPKPSDADSQPIPQIAFCRKCGNKLSEGSRFCNMCGTEVIKE